MIIMAYVVYGDTRLVKASETARRILHHSLHVDISYGKIYIACKYVHTSFNKNYIFVKNFVFNTNCVNIYPTENNQKYINILQM